MIMQLVYDGTLLCAVELDWAVVVVLVPNSFDFLTGGRSTNTEYYICAISNDLEWPLATRHAGKVSFKQLHL